MKITTKEEYQEILLGKSAKSVKELIHVIKCERPGCDSVDIYSWEKQHKSGDEGTSIFHKCKKCNYVFISEDQ